LVAGVKGGLGLAHRAQALISDFFMFRHMESATWRR
jgi:hypothetical protein